MNLIMTEFKLMVSLIWLVLWPVTYTSPKIKKQNRHILHRTGELIAVDNLIQKYEKEHQTFYDKEVKYGDYLEWPALFNKNLSDYCRKYLQQCVIKRNTSDVIGIRIRKTLCYVKTNTSITNEVVIVQCRVSHKSHITSYYMARAPNTNCVYALKSTGRSTDFTLTIINKYCDFEDKPLIKSLQKQNKGDMVGEIHYRTRQPIAKDEYLLKYELEHQEFLNGEGGMCVTWPQIMLHPNLDSYCYKYLEKCVPGRKRENVSGKYQTSLLYYHKVKKSSNILVTTVSCIINVTPKCYYYMTRAPETNCVYALLRSGHNTYAPFKIIFKYCDFEDPIDQQTISKDCKVLDKSVMVKTEISEEKYDKYETLQFFPGD